MSENTGAELIVFASDESIKALLVEIGELTENATRQVRRKAIADARKVLKDKQWTRDAAKRAFGWMAPEERAARNRRSRGSAAAALGMMSALGGMGRRF